MPSIYQTTTPQATIELGTELASRLKPGDTVLLFGDLGSGKTHFVKGIAKGLGIEEIIKSPTFTYVHEYSLPLGDRLYHYDLYRLHTGDEFYSIGLEESLHNSRAINIIEWADRLDGMFPPDFIRVDFRNFFQHHEICITFEDAEVAPDTLVEQFWQTWGTPLHVREHCKKVSRVACQIADAFIQKNILINWDLIKTAALLHDMARVCDFKTLDRNKFHESITEEKWERWTDLRKRFEGMHHADIAYKALSEAGYLKTAEVIRLHNSLSILREPEAFHSLEIAIVFYADKRVKHTEVVSLPERFRDGRERHGKDDEPALKHSFELVEKETLNLEKRLFSLIDLKPDQISGII